MTDRPDGRERFDVQRRSMFTPEGEIESAGHFARGIGAERLRRLIGVAFGTVVVLIVVLAAISILG